MIAPKIEDQRFEFYFPQVDTLVQVDNSDGSTMIRASRNTFSEARKISFFRELAMEGFISDKYRWSMPTHGELGLGVPWIVDISWIELNPAMLRRTRQFMIRLIGGSLILLLAKLFLVFVHQR